MAAAEQLVMGIQVIQVMVVVVEMAAVVELEEVRGSELLNRVLAVARAYGFTELVLGAWGCGAFRNDPGTTAEDFREAIEGPFSGAFKEIVFAITDWSPERKFLGPFRTVFQ